MSLTSAQRSWLLEQIEELLGVEEKVFSTLSSDDSIALDASRVGLSDYEDQAKVNFF